MMPYVSMATILALIARLTIFVRQRSATEFTHIDSLAAIQIGLIALSCILFVGFPRRQEMWKRLAGTSGIMLVMYYIVSGLSAAWSPLPIYTLFRAVEYISQVLLVFAIIYDCLDFADAERRVLFLAIIVALFGAGMIAKFNGFALSWSRWHTNHYTASAAMIFCYCLGELLTQPKERKKWLRRYGCGALGLLLLGTSTASFLAVGAGGAVAILLSRRGRSLLIPLIVIISVTSGLAMFARATPVFPSWIELGQQLKILSPHHSEQLVFSLHGRSILWELYTQEILNSPIFGHGFAVSSRLASLYSNNTHNGLLAVVLGTGAIGLLIVLWGVYRYTCEATSSGYIDTQGAIGCTAALTAACVNNMSISFVGENWRAPSLLFILFLSLHLFFVLKPGGLPISRLRPYFARLVPLTRSPNMRAQARLRSLFMRRHSMLR